MHARTQVRHRHHDLSRQPAKSIYRSDTARPVSCTSPSFSVLTRSSRAILSHTRIFRPCPAAYGSYSRTHWRSRRSSLALNLARRGAASAAALGAAPDARACTCKRQQRQHRLPCAYTCLPTSTSARTCLRHLESSRAPPLQLRAPLVRQAPCLMPAARATRSTDRSAARIARELVLVLVLVLSFAARALLLPDHALASASLARSRLLGDPRTHFYHLCARTKENSRYKPTVNATGSDTSSAGARRCAVARSLACRRAMSMPR